MATKKKAVKKAVKRPEPKKQIKKPVSKPIPKPAAKSSGFTLPKGNPNAKGVDVGTEPIAAARKQAESAGLPRFKLDSGETAVVRFLIDDKTHFRSAKRHPYIENNAGEIGNFTCNEKHESPCFLCETADDKPRVVTMLPILNRTEGRLEVIEKGSRFAGQVVAYFNKYGSLIGRDFDIARQGKGMQDTLWTIIPNDPEELDAESRKLIEDGVNELFEKIDRALEPKSNADIEAWYGGNAESYDDKKEKSGDENKCGCGADVDKCWTDVEFEDGTEGYECSKCGKYFDTEGSEVGGEEETEKKDDGKERMLCPECEGEMPISATKCPHCGTEFEE